MSIGILDIVVLVIVLGIALKGYTQGMFKSGLSMVGSVLIFVLAFYLKNPISQILYEKLPFFSFSGIFAGITSFNILLYEGIAYIICFFILSLLMTIIINFSGIFDKILKMSVILKLPDKIIGAVFGAIEGFIYAFALVFICAQLSITSSLYNSSYFADKMIHHTPILSNIVSDLYSTISEVYEVCTGKKDNESADHDTLEILMKYDIITSESVQKLTDEGKLKVKNTDELTDKYKDDTND